MRIGVPKEIKRREYRVALTPAGAEAMLHAGHDVVVERGAGVGSGFDDGAYEAVGATMARLPNDAWDSDLVLKVKEPIEEEWPRIRPGQTLFTYFHFAASESLTRAVMESGAVAMAYETVEATNGDLPLLIPMSEVAGRMAIQEGTKCLERHAGGGGVLLGGVPGVLPGKVVILGGGVVGMNAARMAAGLGARVTILEVSLPRLRYLEGILPANVSLLFSTRYAIKQELLDADLVVGAVLLPGARAPGLVSEGDLKSMKDGSVIVDVAVDQGGCVETIRPTTHDDPTYVVHGVVHYGVANMPGAVPRTSTVALTNATLPYALSVANQGWWLACTEDAGLAAGVNIVEGRVTCRGVADAFGLECCSLRDVMATPVTA